MWKIGYVNLLTNGGDDFDPGEDTPIQEQMRNIGKLGGKANAKKNGANWMAHIGSFGGSETYSKRGHEYYVELGRKGGLARAAKRRTKNPNKP